MLGRAGHRSHAESLMEDESYIISLRGSNLILKAILMPLLLKTEIWDSIIIAGQENKCGRSSKYFQRAS